MKHLLPHPHPQKKIVLQYISVTFNFLVSIHSIISIHNIISTEPISSIARTMLYIKHLLLLEVQIKEKSTQSAIITFVFIIFVRLPVLDDEVKHKYMRGLFYSISNNRKGVAHIVFCEVYCILAHPTTWRIPPLTPLMSTDSSSKN